MLSFMKTIIFSPNVLPGTLSSDVHLPRRSPCKRASLLLCSWVFEQLTICQLEIYLARPQNILAMYNFSCSVTDHDDFLPAIIMVQSPCHSSQCTSTHSATEDVHSRHYLRTRTVVPSTSTVPTETCTVAPTTSTVPHHTRTVVHDTCTVVSSARTVAPTTSTLASSAASAGQRTRFVVAPTTATVAIGSVTVTTSTVCDAGLAHARFNHGLACCPTSHTESINTAF